MNKIKEEMVGAPANSMGASSPSNPDSPIAMPERRLIFGPIRRIRKAKKLREITGKEKKG